MSESPCIDVFISYSREDVGWLKKLMTHLKPLVRAELIGAWSDQQIEPGSRWREEIDRALASCRVGVLLVSPEFLASDFIMKHEVPRLLDAVRTRGLTLIPVLLSECSVDKTPLSQIQAAFDPRRALDDFKGPNRNKILTRIAKKVADAVAKSERNDVSYRPDDESWPDFEHDLHDEDLGCLSGGRPKSRSSLRDRDDERDDFLARVAEVCTLRTPQAQLRRRQTAEGRLVYLHVTTAEGPFTTQYPLAAFEHGFSIDDLHHFLEKVHHPYRETDPAVRSQIVCGPSPLDEKLVAQAEAANVWLRSFVEYEGLIDFSRYVQRQTEKLAADPIYPPQLYVPQRYSWEIGTELREGDDALQQVFDWLAVPDGQFILVLGDFGTGKTFLLHELADRLPKQLEHLTPVLIEMRALEKGRTLDELVAQHLVQAGEDRFDMTAFRYMLRQGRIALLFDGFDELALRVTYERAAEHFDTLTSAAEGQAKVVVTSRTQHFVSDQQVKQALYAKVEHIAGRRLVRLKGFSEPQIRSFLVNRCTLRLTDQNQQPANPLPRPLLEQAERDADERLQLIHNVRDLLGLSHNPRMLGFIAELEADQLREAERQAGRITSAELYQLLLQRWLEHEYDRQRTRRGSEPTLTVAQRWEAVTSLAVRLWQKMEIWADVTELEDHVARAVQHLAAAQAAYILGTGALLVRNAEGRFSFVHQSVMEWLVARSAAEAVKAGEMVEVLTHREMSPLMAEFFCGLAGHDVAEQWAQRALARPSWLPDDPTKVNAMLVRERLEVVFGRRTEGTSLAIAFRLAGQDLSGRDYSCQDLRNADLRGARLAVTRFRESDMRGANLFEAVVHGADLTRADLRNCDLSRADLTGANLLGADLRGVRNRETILRRARLIGATLDADFVQAVSEHDLFGAALPATSSLTPFFSSAASACKTVTVSTDSTLVASGHDDGTVRLWDTQSGKEIQAFFGHKSYVLSVAFSPDGLKLVSGSADHSVRLWETSSGKELQTWRGHQGPVGTVAFSPDGHQIATGSEDNSVRFWEPQTGNQIRPGRGHQRSVWCVAFSPDGRQLASGSVDSSIRLWDARNGEEIRSCRGHMGSVWSVAFSPDASHLVSGAEDHSVRIWDTQSGKEIRVIRGHQDSVRSVAFSPDGAKLASASADGTIRIWSVATGQWLVTLLPLPEEGWAAVLPDGRYKLVGDPAGRFWHVANLCRFEPGELAPYVESCRPLPLDAVIL